MIKMEMLYWMDENMEMMEDHDMMIIEDIIKTKFE